MCERACLFLLVAAACAAPTAPKPIAALPAPPVAPPCTGTTYEGVAFRRGFFPEGALPQDLDGHNCAFFTEHLRALGEPALYPPGASLHTYRFLWLRTFAHPISIRIDVAADQSATLTVKETAGMGGYEPGELVVDRTKRLGAGQVRELLYRMGALKFWEPEWWAHRNMLDMKEAQELRRQGWKVGDRAMASPPRIVAGGTATTGAIEGRVFDLDGGTPLMLATAVAREIVLGPGITSSEFTGEDGRYVISGLGAGEYSLALIYGGAKIEVDARVLVGQATQIDAAIDGVGAQDLIVLDGSKWILEGVKGDSYRVLVRKSPKSSTKHDGKRFLDVTEWLLDHADLGIPASERT